MFNLFTDRVRQAMLLANQESQARHAEWVGTGDMLLGLMRADTRLASEVFATTGATLESLRHEVLTVSRDTAEIDSGGETSSKRAITRALDDLQQRGGAVIDTLHLLHAVLSQSDSVAVRALDRLGINSDDICDIVKFAASSAAGESSELDGNISDRSEQPSKQIATTTPRLEEIPELAEFDSGRAIVRIPAEQNVPFTSRVRAIVDTHEFQRLSEISQLGLVAKVYPGARHTRFEHALGVYHNAVLYLKQLAHDQRFAELIDVRHGELLIVSALLHDLGHWPFCHPIEDLGIEGLPTHEEHARRFLAPGTELAEVLTNQWDVDPQDVIDVLAGTRETAELSVLRSILSGPIDIDKLDYLERDSLHSGVPYGRHFDKQRLIQSLVLNEAGDGLAITSKGKTAAELMVHSRYVMFSEVYWHHAVRSATSMFARAFFELRERVDLRLMFTDSDAGMIATLRAAAVGHPAAELLESVFGRRRALYKRAAEFSHLNEAAVYEKFAGRPFVELVEVSRRLAERLRGALGQEVSEMQVLVDGPPPHREVEFAVDVYFPKEGVYRPLRSVSPMIDALARTSFDDYVKRVRVFVDPALIGTTRSAGMDDVWWRTAILASV